MAIKRALKILDKQHLRQSEASAFIIHILAKLESTDVNLYFTSRQDSVSSLFPAGGHIWVKRPSDAVTPAMNEMLMMMLTMILITISDRTCF